MEKTLHLTSGDSAGGTLKQSGVPGEIFVWHDVLYDGPRRPGWPDDAVLEARAKFLEAQTCGGLDRRAILEALKAQYEKLRGASRYDRVVLWFDACLFDQSMLVHVLACLKLMDMTRVDLLCLDAFPGIEPFNGLGEMTAEQLASVYGDRRAVTAEQFDFATQVDAFFASCDLDALRRVSQLTDAPLPWVPRAAARWILEQPDPQTGLGRLETLILEAVEQGCRTPQAIYRHVAECDTTPQFWGDTTLWAKINRLASCRPPLLRIDGPAPLLPQWESDLDLGRFTVQQF